LEKIEGSQEPIIEVANLAVKPTKMVGWLSCKLD
jgi:hypothetical protein